MKKILMGSLVVMFLLSGVFAVNVEALSVEEGNNSATNNVTVGDVDTPVYAVDINWGDFKYDWVYDSQTKTYGWKSSVVEKCEQVIPDDAVNTFMGFVSYNESQYAEQVAANNIYSDETCSTVTKDVAFGDFETPVWSKHETSADQRLIIVDNSTAGQIVPSVSWNSAENYDWVTGRFGYSECDSYCMPITSEEGFRNSASIFTDSTCSGETVVKDSATYQPDTYYALGVGCTFSYIENGPLPDSVREFAGAVVGGGISYAYYLDFELEVDSNKTIITPQVGDTIGTITVSIAAKQ